MLASVFPALTVYQRRFKVQVKKREIQDVAALARAALALILSLLRQSTDPHMD